MARRQRFFLCAFPALSAVLLASDGKRPAPAPESLSSTPFPAPLFVCASSIRDQANPGACLDASTTPTLGALYPISSNLFVAVGGDVGIGTTSPAAKLDVTGTARITDTLTLDPSGDQALDVSTGSIYKGGALFIHTKGGIENTALGSGALAGVTGGYRNTAVGYRALYPGDGSLNTAIGNRALSTTTTGFLNTAVGLQAMQYNTGGGANIAVGASAMRFSGSGGFNVAVGIEALRDNTTGYHSTATGTDALVSNTTGAENCAFGSGALNDNTSGSENTASGTGALFRNTTASKNVAFGSRALQNNTIGATNSACGSRALLSNTTGSNNTACGYGALSANTTGASNIALGRNAGASLTTGSNNIAIGSAGVAAEGATIRIGTAGTQTRAFIAGIRGVTTGVANGITVLVDSAGQLGTVSSSRRFKKDIADMGDRTERLLELRPVVFHYKEAQTLPNGGEVPLEYGLIAEEVAEIFPDLVVYGDDGQPFTVKYHLLSAMLLNELKNESRELGELRREVGRLRGMEARLAALESRTSRIDSPAAIPSDHR